ncbi:PepSY-associated transmembrane protein [Aquimarina sp. MAR_2010_214]|nr:PepSY-associated transmembrane protein [Aquimarina sp. MAR_2010_214]
MGLLLFLLFVVISMSGLLLGWKKHSNGYILPKSYQGTSTNLEKWLSFDKLHTIACNTLHDSIDAKLSLKLSRIDARPRKGIVKFVFKDHYWGIQVDGATGKILHIGKRRSDFIENIHDGSFLDDVFNTKSEILKLTYTTTMGLSLLIFTITGFWLWYGPKIMRKKNKRA